MSTIAIVGSWHQAMVVSACMADVGHKVRGICANESVADALNAGRPVLHEPGLAAVMRRNLKRKRLSYTTDYAAGLAKADVAYICIDTPVAENDDSELDSIVDAARQIGRYRTGNLVLCVSAQVPVGTTEALRDLVRAGSGRGTCDAAYVPEFLRLGTALKTFRQADRFVIGVERPEIAERVKRLYRPLRRPMIVTDVRTAEMGKHASNAYLATTISFINEIADLCEKVGADAQGVAAILKSDKRIGRAAFLSPGLGFAGGTLGRELRALQVIGRREGRKTRLLDAVLQVNADRAGKVIEDLERTLGTLRGCRVGILGLTYKAATSTMRRAISLEIIRSLVERGAAVAAFDPIADMGDVVDPPVFRRFESVEEVASGSDALILVTEWDGVRALDFKALRKRMRQPVFVDTRNVLDPALMHRLGFIYSGIGRTSAQARSAFAAV